jgi:hypothetical protein
VSLCGVCGFVASVVLEFGCFRGRVFGGVFAACGVVCVLGCVGRDEVKEVSTETSQRPWSESVLCLVL